jgi:hypothetical protein
MTRLLVIRAQGRRWRPVIRTRRPGRRQFLIDAIKRAKDLATLPATHITIGCQQMLGLDSE